MTRAAIAERIRNYLSGKCTVKQLYKWYFAEHYKMATAMYESINNGQCLDENVEPYDKVAKLRTEIYLDLDAYRDETEEKTDLSIDESQLRILLKKHLAELESLSSESKK